MRYCLKLFTFFKDIYSYLAGWVAMLLVETPLMIRIYRKK